MAARTPTALPPCCTPSEGATLAETLYCAYNRGGPPDRAGLNFQGQPCPVWANLPDAVRAKWEATALESRALVWGAPVEFEPDGDHADGRREPFTRCETCGVAIERDGNGNWSPVDDSGPCGGGPNCGLNDFHGPKVSE